MLYLSKSDKAPFLHNVRVSQLSLYARAWHHAITSYQKPGPIRKADSFIIGCGMNARFAVGVIEEHMDNLRKFKASNRTVLEPNRRCKEVNDIMALLEGEHHIYLKGEPGVGKTELVDFFLKGKKYWKGGEPSSFLFGTLPDEVDYIWFEDFDVVKYHGNLINILSLMDFKETGVSKKCVDDRVILSRAKFIFTSNYNIGNFYNMFLRRVKVFEVSHQLYSCAGCNPDYIPDNQLGLFDISGGQMLIDLENFNGYSNFTLDLSDENARDGFDGLSNIMTTEEQERFFDSM